MTQETKEKSFGPLDNRSFSIVGNVGYVEKKETKNGKPFVVLSIYTPAPEDKPSQRFSVAFFGKQWRAASTFEKGDFIRANGYMSQRTLEISKSTKGGTKVTTTDFYGTSIRSLSKDSS